MAVSAKCDQRGCDFHFDDAEYVDDAVEKLRAHFRDQHHTKAFYEGRYLETIEQRNRTLEEHIETYVGILDWRNNNANGRLHRHVIQACTQVLRYRDLYSPQTVVDAEALIVELGGQIPAQPDANAPGVEMPPFVAGDRPDF